MKKLGEAPILPFSSAKKWREWLHKNHAVSDGVWLRFYKKASGVTTVVYAEALDEALCYGWIDSQTKKYDANSYLQKFTPRRKKSLWSKINREKVARLIKEKRMHPAGLLEIEKAKKDGRWESAYDSSKNMKVPEDFLKALAKNKKAALFFKTLDKANVYAISWRLHHAKKPETRARSIEKFIAMLSLGKKLH
jgi:uncharacterized protein YdeI (YjbR/CyaY-like superfamily)